MFLFYPTLFQWTSRELGLSSGEGDDRWSGSRGWSRGWRRVKEEEEWQD